MEIRADGLGLDPLIALNDDGADGLGIGGACGERYDATTQYSSGEDKAGEAKPSNKPSTKFHPPRALYRPLWAPRPRVPHEKGRSPERPSPYPRKVATSLRRRPLGGEMEDVVVSCEDHQHDDDRKPDPKAHLLSALRERFSPYGFDSIKQQVAAIEQRYRKQVEQADRNREHRREAEQRRKAFARHLPRHLGDPNWPAELIGRLATGDDPADVGQGALDDKPRPLHA